MYYISKCCAGAAAGALGYAERLLYLGPQDATLADVIERLRAERAARLPRQN